jgi:GNAT superfamily N-acetyltransferase
MVDRLMIREAQPYDARDIALLIGELGYSITPDQVVGNLEVAASSRMDRVFVAEAYGSVLGVLSIHTIPLFHTVGRAGRITSLVVTEAYSGQGIGTRLVEEAEAWAWSQGCARIEVTSSDRRERAHRFYLRRGYERDDRRFVKIRF